MLFRGVQLFIHSTVIFSLVFGGVSLPTSFAAAAGRDTATSGPRGSVGQRPTAADAGEDFSAVERCEEDMKAAEDRENGKNTQSNARKLEPADLTSSGLNNDQEDQSLIDLTQRAAVSKLGQRSLSGGCDKFLKKAAEDHKNARKSMACIENKIEAPKPGSKEWNADGTPQNANKKPELSCGKGDEKNKADTGKTAANDKPSGNSKTAGATKPAAPDAAEKQAACEEAKKELEKNSATYSEFASKWDKAKQRTVLAGNAIQRQREFEDEAGRKIEEFNKKRKETCERDLAKLKDKNPILKHIEKKDASSSDFAEAAKKCEKESDEQQKAVAKLPTQLKSEGGKASSNRTVGAALSLLSNRTAVNEALKQNPRLCAALGRLRSKSKNLFGVDPLTGTAELAAAIACSNPLTCAGVELGIQARKLFTQPQDLESARGLLDGAAAQGLESAALSAQDKIKELDRTLLGQVGEAGANVAAAAFPGFGIFKRSAKLAGAAADAGGVAARFSREALEASPNERFVKLADGRQAKVIEVADGKATIKVHDRGELIDQTIDAAELEKAKASSLARDVFATRNDGDAIAAQGTQRSGGAAAAEQKAVEQKVAAGAGEDVGNLATQRASSVREAVAEGSISSPENRFVTVPETFTRADGSQGTRPRIGKVESVQGPRVDPVTGKIHPPVVKVVVFDPKIDPMTGAVIRDPVTGKAEITTTASKPRFFEGSAIDRLGVAREDHIANLASHNEKDAIAAIEALRRSDAPAPRSPAAAVGGAATIRTSDDLIQRGRSSNDLKSFVETSSDSEFKRFAESQLAPGSLIRREIAEGRIDEARRLISTSADLQGEITAQVLRPRIAAEAKAKQLGLPKGEISGDGFYYTYSQGSENIGHLKVKRVSSKEIYVDNMRTSTEHTGRGVGTQLLQAVVERNPNVSSYSATLSQSNRSAVEQVYRATGNCSEALKASPFYRSMSKLGFSNVTGNCTGTEINIRVSK